ncbi:hypothetical protein ONZ43_g4889 [Nemania bipapillata]|uniref:Uncharacterized protein n=1 Tax=Nemania bipapillata TaxID=110536 RepID=A0ACC2IH80_9PEZI|nr:hypothetical protein ONZ43_g4889 [Nemania bipapillata]
MPNNLREEAVKKSRGQDANPTQLGDPISLKAETSDYVPEEEEGGDRSPSPSAVSHSSSKRGTLREKAAKKLNGPNANPTQLGDPTSLKNETSPGMPVDSERGTKREEIVHRDSKL